MMTFASLHNLIYLTKINHNLVQIRTIRDKHEVGYSAPEFVDLVIVDPTPSPPLHTDKTSVIPENNIRSTPPP